MVIKNFPKKKTKIIATLGPATSSVKDIKSLLLKGVNVFRLNFSHGSQDEYKHNIAAINEAAKTLDIFPCILADLQGPKIRTGNTKDNKEITLEKGSTITITTKKTISTESLISIDYPNLVEEINKGQSIFINDGKIHLKVKDIVKKTKKIKCTVLKSGSFSSKKGVNLPNAHLAIPSLTAKDKKDLDFILKNNIQLIALSFVRKASDLEALNNIVKKKKKGTKIIAKIETPEAVKNIDAILDKSDGIMVARGDLGIEVSLEKVTILQKDLIAKANQKAKIVIVATEMLESMISNLRPTRAEAADITNAILDDSDCIMLSGETAIGKYPIESVEIMTKLAIETEKSTYYPKNFIDITLSDRNLPHSIAEAAAHASKDQGNVPIIVFTLSGSTANYLSNIRPKGPIYAFSPNKNTVALMSILWNTIGFQIPFDNNVVNLWKGAEQILIKEGLVKKGDIVTIIFGKKSVQSATDSLRMKKVGED